MKRTILAALALAITATAAFAGEDLSNAQWFHMRDVAQGEADLAFPFRDNLNSYDDVVRMATERAEEHNLKGPAAANFEDQFETEFLDKLHAWHVEHFGN